MPATVLTFPTPTAARFGGTTLRAGTWLYAQIPGSASSDAVLVTCVEEDRSPTTYAIAAGFTPLPRTRVWVRTDGGAGPERIVQHIDDSTLRAFVRGNYSHHYGLLEAVYPDPAHRAAFVARCAEEPARRAEEARKVEAEKERVRNEVGPWFADLEEVIAGDRYNVRDTVEAKVIRRCLREIVGVAASVTVRRYSMASGLDFGPAKGARDWTDEEARRIAEVFPGAAWATRVYDRETGEHRDGWRVDCSLYPHKREDRSDGMSDYHDPGGFRVSNAYALAVSVILCDEVRKAEGVR